MPANISTSRSTPIGLEAHPISFLDEREWPLLPYGRSDTAYNLAELASDESIFDISATFYISGLPEGEVVNVRLVTWDRATDRKSGIESTMIVGSKLPEVRGQYNTSVTINQRTQRIAMVAFASVPGVTLDLWRSRILAW